MTIRSDLIIAAAKEPIQINESSGRAKLTHASAAAVVDAVLDRLIDRMTSVGNTASSRLGELNADELRRIRDGMV